MTIKDFAVESALEQGMIISANLVDATLSGVASLDDDVAAIFRALIDEIINNVKIYVDAPEEYAARIIDAIRIVATVPGNLSTKLLGYKIILDTIAKRNIGTPITENKNKLLIDELVGTSALVAASESINQSLENTSTITRTPTGKAIITVPDANTGFQTRSEVMAGVVYLQDNFINLVKALDQGQIVFEDELLIDTYIQSVQSYVPTWQVVSSTMSAAIEISFSLPVKRIVIIERSRTILDLCYEFYLNIEDVALDYFINTNVLTGDMIIEVPAGHEVVYYD